MKDSIESVVLDKLSSIESAINSIQQPIGLRDYFAAKAMSAYFIHLSSTQAGIVSAYYAEVATESYYIADAMLKAREQP